MDKGEANTAQNQAGRGTYFVTIDCWAQRQLLKGEVAEILTDQILQCRRKGYYLLHEFCVLPNHLHVLFTPRGDTTLEKAAQMIKGGASYRIGKRRKFLALWQDGYHDWRCRNESQYCATLSSTAPGSTSSHLYPTSHVCRRKTWSRPHRADARI